MKYFPEPVPYTDDLPYIREWLGREFSNILVAFEGIEMIQLVEDHIAPTDPRLGMIKYADGTNWDPGLGEGFYGYDGTNWVRLGNSSGTLGGVLRLRDPADVTLTSTDHAFQIGLDTAANLAMDGNEIMGRNNGAVGELNLQANGGEVRMHVNDPTNAASLLRLAGGRIVFPASQNASTDANTLDDYEEGTWTPGFAFNGGTTGITYNTQVGSYVKVGQLVFYQGRVILTNNGSSAGNLWVTGLPFTAANTGHGYTPSSVGYYSSFVGLTGSLKSYVEVNNTYLNIVQSGATGVGFVNDGNTNDTTDIIFAGTYRASA